MSDLISRSDVLKLPRYNFGVSMLSAEEYIKVSDIKKILTAYDIDKVVDELETEKTKALELFDGNSRYKGYCKAIEIVKQGGVETDTETIRENTNGYSKEDIELNRKAMYNKAIDDFVAKYKYCDNRSIQCHKNLNCADCIAEQLKAGEQNG